MIHIPYVDESKLIVKFARSSGPGGQVISAGLEDGCRIQLTRCQHVNKTESKVDMRVRLQDINLPKEVLTQTVCRRDGEGAAGHDSLERYLFFQDQQE